MASRTAWAGLSAPLLRALHRVPDVWSRLRSSSARAAWPRALGRVLPAGLLAVAFTSTGLPPLLDRVLPRVYPDVTVEKKLLGLFPRQTKVDNPRIPVRRRQIIVLAWILTGAGSAGAFLRILARGRHREDADRYVLQGELGRGGTGIVWIARDTVLDRQVALKELVIPPATRDEVATRFRQEARALARLAHPNIVPVHDLVDLKERFRMVLELAEGGSLAERLAGGNGLEPPEAARVLAGVASGLSFAHAHGVIHRDVKPANILFDANGVPKIADFGLAKLSGDGSMTVAGSVLGSPLYLSPEQAEGAEADARSDVYSLGVTLYETLTGHRPFEGEVVELLSRHRHEAPVPVCDLRPEVPTALADLTATMMAKNPADRPDLTEVVNVLRDVAREVDGPQLATP